MRSLIILLIISFLSCTSAVKKTQTNNLPVAKNTTTQTTSIQSVDPIIPTTKSYKNINNNQPNNKTTSTESEQESDPETELTSNKIAQEHKCLPIENSIERDYREKISPDYKILKQINQLENCTFKKPDDLNNLTDNILEVYRKSTIDNIKATNNLQQAINESITEINKIEQPVNDCLESVDKASQLYDLQPQFDNRYHPNKFLWHEFFTGPIEDKDFDKTYYDANLKILMQTTISRCRFNFNKSSLFAASDKVDRASHTLDAKYSTLLANFMQLSRSVSFDKISKDDEQTFNDGLKDLTDSFNAVNNNLSDYHRAILDKFVGYASQIGILSIEINSLRFTIHEMRNEISELQTALAKAREENKNFWHSVFTIGVKILAMIVPGLSKVLNS